LNEGTAGGKQRNTAGTQHNTSLHNATISPTTKIKLIPQYRVAKKVSCCTVIDISVAKQQS